MPKKKSKSKGEAQEQGISAADLSIADTPPRKVCPSKHEMEARNDVNASAAPSQPEDNLLQVGAIVKIHSLQAKPQHNGVYGEIVSAFDASKMRWGVKLKTDGRVLALKPANLMPVQTSGLCEEQREALARLMKIQANFARWEETSLSPEANAVHCGFFPGLMQRNIEVRHSFVNEIAKLEAEVARPSSLRLPKDSAPDSSVMRVLASLTPVQPCSDKFVTPQGPQVYGQVVRFVEADCARGQVPCKMGLGVCLTEMVGGNLGRKYHVASAPWRIEMGRWSEIDWAWFLCLMFHEFNFPGQLVGVTLTYKMQDLPQSDFPRKVEVAFRDVCRTVRCAPFAAQLASARFEDYSLLDHKGAQVSLDVNLANDICHAFDTKIFQVARDLGLAVEDRSSSPALTFSVGCKMMPVEHPGGGMRARVYDTPEDYIRARLKPAVLKLGAHSELSKDEAEKHVEYLVELLKAQQVTGDIFDTDVHGSIWEVYKNFTEKKLGKALRKVAQRHHRPVPDASAELSMRRCSACGAAEGTKSAETGKLVDKLVHCPCNPHGLPLYCGAECQRRDRKDHAEFCTHTKPDKKKK